MMRTCDKCGALDDMENMFYTNTFPDIKCVCEGCAKDLGTIPVSNVISALSGSTRIREAANKPDTDNK